MEEAEQKIGQKEKAKLWLKDRYNLAFLGILILSIAIRIYYFFMTKDQPLWWDESDYMAYSKTLAGMGTDWTVSAQHNSLYPYIVAILFKIGFSEAAVRFTMGVLPSILIVFLTYEIAKLMFNDKKIALISAFLMALFWSILFNAMRFHLDTPALFFCLLATYVFFKGYENKEKIFWKIDPKWAVPLTAFFVMIAYMLRRGVFFFALFFLFHMFFTTKFKDLIKNKYLWLALFIGVGLLLISEFFIFADSITEVAGTYFNVDAPFSLMPFEVFPAYFENIQNTLFSPLLYLFWIGFIVMIIELAFVFMYLKTTQNKENKSNLFI